MSQKSAAEFRGWTAARFPSFEARLQVFPSFEAGLQRVFLVSKLDCKVDCSQLGSLPSCRVDAELAATWTELMPSGLQLGRVDAELTASWTAADWTAT